MIAKNIKMNLCQSIAIAKTDFKLRNEGSYLGILWYLLEPILMFLLLFLIFHDRVGMTINNYPVYLLLGIIMFNLFQQVTVQATRSIRENKYIIRSINFSKSSLIYAILFKTIFSHLFEIILLIVIMLFLKVSLIGLVVYPIILFFFGVFTMGIALILAALTVYILDIENIWVFVVRLMWLATPIFYEIGGQTRLFLVNLFNPLYYYITITRYFIINSEFPPLWMLIVAMVYSLIFLLLGLFVFNKLKNKFVEKI